MVSKFLKDLCIVIALMILFVSKISHQHNHQNCDHPHQIIILNESVVNSRGLQTTDPYNFRIKGVFHNNSPLVLKKLFSIATNYFNKVIKVTKRINRNQTAFPNNTNICLGYTISEDYRQNGFDVNLIDSIVFVVVNNNSNTSTVAFSGACILLRWPIYGVLSFNQFYIEKDFKKTGLFHNNLYTTIHELTHILGFSTSLFSLYFSGYNSQIRMNRNSVVTTIQVNGNNKQMIITPKVVQYVNQYFGCNNSSIGALLEDQGGVGSSGSHWERKVYLDEIMTASVRLQGSKVSSLTLSLLADTGYYFSVDTTMVENFQFGRGKGCQFALGLSNPSPEFCKPVPDITTCDFYGFYAGLCATSDSLSNQSPLIHPYSNTVCTLPQNSLGQSPSTGEFNALSRCFNGVDEGNGSIFSKCYRSMCSNDGIIVQFGSQVGLCNSITQTISLGNHTIRCPQNITLFCVRKMCSDWCSTRGLCINGECLISLCLQIDPSCSQCYNGECYQCINSLYPSLDRSRCIKCDQLFQNCSSCVKTQENTICSQCQSGYILSDSKIICQSCSQSIQHCQTCSTKGQNPKCLLCASGYFFNQSSSQCKLCSSQIPFCLTCSFVANVVTCINCLDKFSLVDKNCLCLNVLINLKCISCTKKYCVSCNEFSDCQECKNGFKNINGNCMCDQGSLNDQLQVCEIKSVGNLIMIIGISVGLFLALVIILLAVRCWCKSNLSQKNQSIQNIDNSIKNLNSQIPSAYNASTILSSIRRTKQQQIKLMKTITCPICLQVGVTHQGTCRHFYHYQCIDQWVQRNHTCPECSKPTVMEDVHQIEPDSKVIRFA